MELVFEPCMCFLFAGVNHTTWKRFGLCAVFAKRAVFVHKGADVSSNVHVFGWSNFGTDILWAYYVWRSGRLAESHTECLHAGTFFIYLLTCLTLEVSFLVRLFQDLLFVTFLTVVINYNISVTVLFGFIDVSSSYFKLFALLYNCIGFGSRVAVVISCNFSYRL